MSFRQKLYGFLQGRNGPDALSHAMAFMCVALVIVNFFVASVVIYCIELALMLLWIFRIFSRNLARRRAENMRYLALRDRVKGFFRRNKRRFSERKTHVYVKCPGCKATLRLPRVKGRHTARCPKCGNEFGVDI